VRTETVIFLHIPKTAGTTLSYILEKQYEAEKTFTIDDYLNPDQGGSSIEKFVKLPFEYRKGIMLLKGHMPFGLHQMLPNPPIYLTILRNPVDRAISQYYHLLRQPDHYLYKTVTANKMTLEDFVCSRMSPELNNGQTRLLSGVSPADAECSVEMLQQAMANLSSRIAVVGLCEMFDKTLMLIKNQLQWKRIPFYCRMNVSRNRPSREDITRRALKLIERENLFDCQLYKYAVKLFGTRIAEQEHQVSIELKRFVVLNSIYQKCLIPYWSSRAVARGVREKLSTVR
jgi:hypothetical protein